jgi:hypothetical protein
VGATRGYNAWVIRTATWHVQASRSLPHVNLLRGISLSVCFNKPRS